MSAESCGIEELHALLENVFAKGGTARTLIVALCALPCRVVHGATFRAALDRYGLRPVFDTVLQDREVLNHLEAMHIAPPAERRALTLRLTKPLVLRQRIGVSSFRLHVNREVVLYVDDRDEVELRRGDITLSWMRMREEVLVRLRQARDRSGAPQDLMQVSAGHVISQTYPLDVITLPRVVHEPPPPPPVVVAPSPAPEPAPPPSTPARVAPARSPTGVTLTVVHRTRGRVRLRIAQLYRNETEKTRLERALRGRVGVLRAVASSLTGTLLICFEPSLDYAELERMVRRILSGEDAGEEGYRAQPRHPWHLFDVTQTALLLESSPRHGLSAAVAAERLQRYGPNRLPQAVGRAPIQMLLEQFASLPVAFLGVSAMVSFFTGGWVDGVVILGVVALNAGIGFSTEYWAEQTIAGLNRGVQPHAVVVRDGREYEVPSEILTPGDLIILRRGMAVPADARLIEADNLSVDESALTGESVPVHKSVAPLHERTAPLGSRTNMVYRGTVVTGGSGRALVVATGAATEVGEIQRLLGETIQPETPLQRQLRTLSGQLVVGSLALCGIVFVVGLMRGYGLGVMLKTSIALAVAAVPEGLPTVATTTLAIGLRRLEQQGVLVRRLVAVETLGAIEYLCLDKTGTITRNEMTLMKVMAGMVFYERGSEGLARTTSLPAVQRASSAERPFAAAPVNPDDVPEIDDLLRLTVLCSEVRLEKGADGLRLIGTPTETALVRGAQERGIDVRALRMQYPLLRMRLRGEGRGFMDTLHEHEGRRLLAVKGSPDQVLDLCNRISDGGRVRPLTEEDRERIEVENERLAGQALRVLGVAWLPDDGLPEVRRDLIWVGLAAIADPPRPEIPALIERLHGAGIRTIMITGDQSATATAIARQIGLGRAGKLESLDAARLETLPSDVLRSLAEQVDIFSRVSPAHKLNIVQALQQAGHVVAMTGDGINDGPALRAADIGIAMGASGSEVAQEVADVIVRDDNLATLVGAIEQGRTIASDIKKSVHFILASNSSEILLTFITTLAGLGEPLSPLQLLWINLVTDVFPELALGLEPPEYDVMLQPPRDPQAPMFCRHDVQRIAVEGATMAASALGAYSWGLARYGLGAQAGTLAFTTLTASQLLYAISCRSEQHWLFDRKPSPPNPYMTLAVGGGLALQGAATILPGLRQVLGTTLISPFDWLVVATLAVTPYLASELMKAIDHPCRTAQGVSGRESVPIR